MKSWPKAFVRPYWRREGRMLGFADRWDREDVSDWEGRKGAREDGRRGGRMRRDKERRMERTERENIICWPVREGSAQKRESCVEFVKPSRRRFMRR